ncbi:MAG: hypothetical protein A2X47_12550 [Lentisphaerae bacterium GWF2_38_69]|nr:MAG: hypothetical protein A2X47_12550 [Lentisphaerae bacterium GWF2_38_69]
MKFPDKAWWSNKETLPSRVRGMKLLSCYIDMTDDIKIAADIYLPLDMEPGEKLPTVFYMTRSTRRFNLRQPFKYFIEKSKRYFYSSRIRKFLNSSYAVVSIDQRASGASFGTRSREWTPEDANDAYAVLDWITNQTWSDCRTVLIGTGSSAVSVELLIAKHHPSVKAAILASSPFDLYPDIVCPGGVRNERFLFYWFFYNYYRDREKIPSLIPMIKRYFLMIVTKGAANVTRDRKLLAELKYSKAQRKETFSYYEIQNYIFRDDSIMNGMLDNCSPHFYLKELNTSNVPICSISGWKDGAYPLGAIKRFMNVQNPGSRLILGNWSNNRYLSLLPFSCRRFDSLFDQTSEAIRFMNYHLKGIDNGFSKEDSVHYFTIGREQWQMSSTWPPHKTDFHSFYFRTNNIVIDNIPSHEGGEDKIKFDYQSTTGINTCWTSLLQKDCKEIKHKSTDEQDDLSLIYATPPFEEDFEICGSAVISLYIKSNITDIQLFVYISDMRSEGNRVHITEGIFRTIHKNINNLQAPYEVLYPTHTFLRKDASFLSPLEPNLVSFDLLPVSYLIKKGHSLRIRITGSDKDNFEIIGTSPEITLCHGMDFPSSFKLPGHYCK